MPMDDYYSEISIPNEHDNESVFNEHVVRDSEDLRYIDNLLNKAFTEEDE